MRELALFAGAGGGILGGILLGWRTVCAVEIAAYRRSVLLRRQRQGMLPRFPIWDDVCTFDGNPWRGAVDIISGGFPCQDISCAGRGLGIDGPRSGLWKEFARIIREVRPRFAFVENSPVLTRRGLHRVLGDLAEMGYDAEWGVLSAADAQFLDGTPVLYHDRYRIWIVAAAAYAAEEHGTFAGSATPESGWLGQESSISLSQRERVQSESRRSTVRKRSQSLDVGREDADSQIPRARRLPTRRGRQGQGAADSDGFREAANAQHDPACIYQFGEGQPHSDTGRYGWWSTEPRVGRVAHGVAHRVDRLEAIGDGQVPAVVALAWTVLSRRLERRILNPDPVMNKA
jgi:DNA (cytosine-5)-methyltransferase 1